MTRSTDRFVELKRRSENCERKPGQPVCFHPLQLIAARRHRGQENRGVMLLVYGFHRKEEQMEALRENASIYIEKDYQKNYDGYSENNPTQLLYCAECLYGKIPEAKHPVWQTLLNKEFVEDDGRRSRGVKEQGVLVLAHSAMPAVLVETGYINNPREEKIFKFGGRPAGDCSIHCKGNKSLPETDKCAVKTLHVLFSTAKQSVYLAVFIIPAVIP